MRFVTEKSGVQVAGNLRYATIQASALMVAAVDRVCRARNYVVACEKTILKDQVLTLENRTERLEDQVRSLTREKNVLPNKLAQCQCQLAQARVDGAIAWGDLQWVLEKGVVRVLDRVIDNTEFARGIKGVSKACEALGFERVKQLSSCSTTSGRSGALDPDHVARKAEEVDNTLVSLAEMDFTGLFHLGELDYNGFR
ncbi:unnamed protein product [Lactuca saligna]|uniref:Uncharacterized protein n=1 Tax=Lactuca saligna TaxID=75948 RepID=A0AA36EBU9_LACSI|nr:unnamed protein product [Lactuca saligna]